MQDRAGVPEVPARCAGPRQTKDSAWSQLKAGTPAHPAHPRLHDPPQLAWRQATPIDLRAEGLRAALDKRHNAGDGAGKRALKGKPAKGKK